MEKDKLIEIAVNWWADKLYSCKHSGLSTEERKDTGNCSPYKMAEMLMTLSKPQVTKEQVEKFKESLTTSLKTDLPHCLSVDYDPDQVLLSALNYAGINSSMGTLPIKTCMWLDNGKVAVRYGYGSPAVELTS